MNNEYPKPFSREKSERQEIKDFFDCVLPGTMKFLTDHYLVGDSYRCVWSVREYPPTTDEQCLFSGLADKNGVTLRIYHRLVEAVEQRKIIQNAMRKNKMKSLGNDVTASVEAAGNLQDVVELLAGIRKSRECLLHVSVFIELKAKDLETLKNLQSEVQMELARSKISVDRLTLRQKDGFLSVLPWGTNRFGTQYERVLQASSAANFYPFGFSGKTDPQGLYIGRDKFGTNILVDLDRRAEDKTTSNVLILGNSGQGKSYLMKLLLCNIRESGKKVICLDSEQEYEELCESLGGCYIDFLSGKYKINPLEPKAWSDNPEEPDAACPEAFKKVTRLSQHIAFLKDFFRSYKDFDDAQVDTIEILLTKRLKDAMLFNILSYMSNQLLGEGNTVASIDELYLFLTNMTGIEYIRNAMKRVRKKESSVILSSQNIEDFLLPGLREYTKPLFSIPTHQFLFHAGQINPKEYMDALQIEPSEFELIKYPERGTCLYRCGKERYLLQVIAPEYKSKLFGQGGGR